MLLQLQRIFGFVWSRAVVFLRSFVDLVFFKTHRYFSCPAPSSREDHNSKRSDCIYSYSAVVCFLQHKALRAISYPLCYAMLFPSALNLCKSFFLGGGKAVKNYVILTEYCSVIVVLEGPGSNISLQIGCLYII